MENFKTLVNARSRFNTLKTKVNEGNKMMFKAIFLLEMKKKVYH